MLTSPALFLLGVNASLFVIGMFIETSAAIIVLAPILTPVAMHFGVDPVHFGMIMVVNLALGMITPPFGVNLFAACTVARISLDQIIKHLVPFVAVVVGCLMLISYIPIISLGLRDIVYPQNKETVVVPSIGPSVGPSIGPSPGPAVGPSVAPSIGPSPAPSPSMGIGPSPVTPAIGPQSTDSAPKIGPQ